MTRVWLELMERVVLALALVVFVVVVVAAALVHISLRLNLAWFNAFSCSLLCHHRYRPALLFYPPLAVRIHACAESEFTLVPSHLRRITWLSNFVLTSTTNIDC